MKGLLFGLYSNVESVTINEKTGSFGYEVTDSQTYVELSVDYLYNNWKKESTKERYQSMLNSLIM